MNFLDQFRQPLFWIPLLLVACGLAFSLYADSRIQPGHIGEAFAANAGYLFLGTLILALGCGIRFLTKQLWLPGFFLTGMVLIFACRLFI